MDDQPIATDAEPPHFLEVYKLSVEMADRVSARRGTANGFFLTLHTGLAAFAGLVGSSRLTTPSDADRFGLLLTASVGIVLSATWWILLRSYRDLNRAKFKVITSMEEQYMTVRPFADEWRYLKSDPVAPWRQRYAELGFIERWIPVAFAAVYVAICIRVTVG